MSYMCSFNRTFQLWLELQTWAVSRTVSQNCLSWQFYGSFLAQREIYEKILTTELPYRAVSRTVSKTAYLDRFWFSEKMVNLE
jgi:hypothetical protein